MATMRGTNPYSPTQIPEPSIARFLFADTRMAWLWLIVRLYVGYQWLIAGIDKLTGCSIDVASNFGVCQSAQQWVFTSNSGAAIVGFSRGALQQTTGEHPSVTGWYGWFLENTVIPNAAVFAYIVTFGEVAVGIGLIIGLLTGIAAFFGAFMNFNYLLAGTVSTNAILGFLALFLILAWRIAGWYGVDRWLLPLLGTPWSQGQIARSRAATPPPAPGTGPGSAPV